MKLFTILVLLIALVRSQNVTNADEIAFFYALDTDLETLKAQAMIVRQPIKIGDRLIETLELGRHRIFAIKMGSGAVATAISAQALLGRFRCDHAISLGPIGALSDNLQVDHWYRVASVITYQKGSWSTSGFQLHEKSTVKLENLNLKDNLVPILFRNVRPIEVASGEIFIASTNYREGEPPASKGVTPVLPGGTSRANTRYCPRTFLRTQVGTHPNCVRSQFTASGVFPVPDKTEESSDLVVSF